MSLPDRIGRRRFDRAATREVMRRDRGRGFTLIELVVVVIILGVLAAVAVPKYIALGRDARIASVQTMAATLMSTAQNLRVMCKVATHTYTPSVSEPCNYDAAGQYLTVGGQQAIIHFGWIQGGRNLNINEIDAWVNYSGFTASVDGGSATTFQLDGSPDPANCAAVYIDPFGSLVHVAQVLTYTTGC